MGCQASKQHSHHSVSDPSKVAPRSEHDANGGSEPWKQVDHIPSDDRTGSNATTAFGIESSIDSQDFDKISANEETVASDPAGMSNQVLALASDLLEKHDCVQQTDSAQAQASEAPEKDDFVKRKESTQTQSNQQVNADGSHYEVLGLPSHCTGDDIRKAYLDLLKVCHPDKVDQKQNVQNATSSWFRKVQASYEVLSDPAKREAYDKGLAGPGLLSQSQCHPAQPCGHQHSHNVEAFVTHAKADADDTSRTFRAAPVNADSQTNSAVPIESEHTFGKEKECVQKEMPEPVVVNVACRPQVPVREEPPSWWQSALAMFAITTCTPSKSSTDPDLVYSRDYATAVEETDAIQEGQPIVEEEAVTNDPQPVDPKLKVKEWQFQLRLESKNIEKDIRQVHRDEAKIQRKKSSQEQKGKMQGTEDFEASLLKSKQTVADLERVRDLTQVLCLELTTCITTMRTHQSLVSASVLNKMQDVVRFRGHMQELLDDMRAYGVEVTGEEGHRDKACKLAPWQEEADNLLHSLTPEAGDNSQEISLALAISDSNACILQDVGGTFQQGQFHQISQATEATNGNVFALEDIQESGRPAKDQTHAVSPLALTQDYALALQ